MMAWSVSWAASMTHFDSLARRSMSRRIGRYAVDQGRSVLVEPLGDGRDVLDQVGDVVGEEVDGCDEEVTAAHRRIEDLQVEDRLGRIQREQLGMPYGLLPVVARELPGLLLESLQALLHQRLQGVIDDQIDELLGSVEAAAVLAGVGIGPDGDLAGVIARRLPLQEPLVDRAELLDGHVAVVDEAPAGARVAGVESASADARRVAEAVDDWGDLRVGEPDPLQQRGGLRGEQTAVVGRQADGEVALVDDLEQVHQPVVVVAGDRGEDVPGRPSGRRCRP